MRGKALCFSLVLLAISVHAAEPEEDVRRGGKNEPVSPAVSRDTEKDSPHYKPAETENESTPAFQPSEEIMADTLLTLPADI